MSTYIFALSLLLCAAKRKVVSTIVRALLLTVVTHLTRTSSVDTSLLSKTEHTTHCPWKGDAAYYSINLDSKSSMMFV